MRNLIAPGMGGGDSHICASGNHDFEIAADSPAGILLDEMNEIEQSRYDRKLATLNLTDSAINVLAR